MTHSLQPSQEVDADLILTLSWSDGNQQGHDVTLNLLKSRGIDRMIPILGTEKPGDETRIRSLAHFKVRSNISRFI